MDFAIPKIEGMMNVNSIKKFQFLKSLDIASINNELESLHLSTHEFWKEEKVRKQFLEFVSTWSKNPVACFHKSFAVQDISNRSDEAEEEAGEVSFVGGLFEMYKSREASVKARAEIISESVISSFTHKFAMFLFGIKMIH